MPFWDLVRGIFGGRNSETPQNKWFFEHRDNYDRDNFRNPIWQNDEDDDDVDDFRHSRGGFHFHIFSDPLEITRYFESQMDNMLRNFEYNFNMFEYGSEGENTFMKALPSMPSGQENLRDKMLKPSTSLDKVDPKLDVDLDGKVTVDNFSEVWDKYNQPKSPEVFVTIKQKFRDSEGNEETIVSRQIGDKMYTVTTKKDKHGVETKEENLVNMDESELKENKWLSLNKSGSFYNFNLNDFNWEKFFKPDPKL
ncbi:uncharacterized protein LOC128877481 [Hylaeus volcanicus]|uniref:uncharacterized protein LOC128877481 n=1 Tax=Hylaeus volcanicus TaxID=313075 RepID=UPI0023B87489|nr:uncharacterized protein LOC128877481 [Hylaeus volcanicus]